MIFDPTGNLGETDIGLLFVVVGVPLREVDVGLRDDIVLLGDGDKFLAVPDDRIDPLRDNGDDFPALELGIGVLLEGLVKFFFNPVVFPLTLFTAFLSTGLVLLLVTFLFELVVALVTVLLTFSFKSFFTPEDST